MGIWDRLRALVGARGNAEPPSPPSPRELFQAAVEAQLRENPAVESVTRRDDFGLDVSLVSGGCHTVFLENTFRETRELSPDERRERIRRLLSGVGHQAPELDWEAARPRLVPLVRACTMFLGMQDARAKLPVRRPFAPFLIETVALDSDESFQYVPPDSAKTWGVRVDDVFAAARETAAACFGDEDIEPYDAGAEYPLWHVARDDGYETSRLALAGWLASFEGRVAGRPVAIIPHRSMLVVGGDGDERCLRRLIDTAEREYAASPRNISPALYTVDAGANVVPLVLPQDHSLANDVALGHLRLAMAEYEAGKDLLQEELGGEVFVASFIGVRREDGTVTSYAVWTEDVPSILPRTAEIALVEQLDTDAKNVFRVPWGAVEQLGLLEPMPHLDPPRWRAQNWPQRDVLERLRQVAVA